MVQEAQQSTTVSFLSARLNLSFDKEKLLRDLNTAQQHFETAPQVGPYHDGSWRGITLRSFKGNLKPFSVIYQGEGSNTEVMQHCPYFQEIFEHFPCPINTARLLFLPPGKVIGKHRDHFSIKTGLVRLHIPIVIHKDVIFKIGNEIMQWQAGELYFGNFAEIHSVKNNSDITRVHLVLDCTVTESLLNLFPESFLETYRKDIRLPLARTENEVEKARLQGYFKLPRGIIRPHIPLIGFIESNQDSLEIQIKGAPMKQCFIPVENNRYAFIDFELTPLPGASGFELKNSNRNFSAQFELKHSLNPFEAVQVFLQTVIGKTLYAGFHAAVATSQFFRKVVKPAA